MTINKGFWYWGRGWLGQKTYKHYFLDIFCLKHLVLVHSGGFLKLKIKEKIEKKITFEIFFKGSRSVLQSKKREFCQFYTKIV